VAKDFSEYRVVREDFAFDAARTAVLVVDMLNDFCEPGGVMELPPGRDLYPALQRLLATARARGVPVVWVCDEHPSELDREFAKRIPHCLAGTWGAQVVDALDVEPGDWRIPKRRFSGFFQTDLDLRLRELGVEHVVVTGVVTNICVRSTVHDAFFRGYDVIVPRDCVAATAPREQDSTLWDIETHFGTVCALEDVLAVVAAEAQPAGA
jgi:ureidoacrylate peracid hydrolase